MLDAMHSNAPITPALQLGCYQSLDGVPSLENYQPATIGIQQKKFWVCIVETERIFIQRSLANTVPVNSLYINLGLKMLFY